MTKKKIETQSSGVLIDTLKGSIITKGSLISLRRLKKDLNNNARYRIFIKVELKN